MREQTDQHLVERARQGDGAAIGELFSRYWRAARAAAFGALGEFAAAEDAAAEGFRQALAGLDTLNDPSRFAPWLRTIVVRKAQLERRGRPEATEAVADEIPDAGERPDTALERVELETLVREAVRQLPARLREAVSLFYIEGYDTDAAARFLDIPSGTFRRRLHEGRERLRSAAEQIMKGNKPMNQEREREIERLRSLIDNTGERNAGPLFDVLRGMVTLRPPARELMEALIRRRVEQGSSAAGENNFGQRTREAAQRFVPSTSLSDPNHPVGSVVAAIRKALPDFQEWQLDLSDTVEKFLGSTADYRTRLEMMLPPGFAEGRPGAFLRPTRAFVLAGESGSTRTTYEVLKESGNLENFRRHVMNMGTTDVLDLTWMASRTLELRSVQSLLEELCDAVLPHIPVRFSASDEPRYRSALKLQLGNVRASAAIGGVLAEWPGRPPGVDAAHVRLFLESWAMAGLQ